ncbi:TPA: nitrite transporter [Raoultella ornithinolytica]|uniref:Nitrite transporter n=1 Tax=Raoultella ornithinolytica TaxID=54291 RepID=A0A9Q9MUI6_RAOOR|nr:MULTISPECIES: nitrite transporter [Raoultella]MEB7601414.1 nitrite transporter [Raoultella terrigena]UXE40058.1 nitrite transporter [Raoultella ornithinolytica]HBY5919938.1 nitrite transporter [Klebsiella pneumoniae]
MLNIDKYLTVRWQMGGRAFPVLDCYGIVHEVRRDLGLPEWPAFEAVIKEPGSPGMGEFCESFSRDLTPCMPCNGAVAACYMGKMIGHLGVVVEMEGLLYVIECNPRRNVTILPLARFERQFLKVEYYQ